MSTLQWSAKMPYKFDTQIFGARSLYYKQNFVIFGGWGSFDYSNRIDLFDPSANTWSPLGELKSKRCYTSVIEKNNEFLIVGAYGIEGDRVRSEKCIFNDDKLTCEYQPPTLNDEGCKCFLLKVILYFSNLPRVPNGPKILPVK